MKKKTYIRPSAKTVYFSAEPLLDKSFDIVQENASGSGESKRFDLNIWNNNDDAADKASDDEEDF